MALCLAVLPSTVTLAQRPGVALACGVVLAAGQPDIRCQAKTCFPFTRLGFTENVHRTYVDHVLYTPWSVCRYVLSAGGSSAGPGTTENR